MAQSLPTQPLSKLIGPTEWNALVNAINAESVDLDTVEARTTNTSGDVGYGNQRLDARLGTGVTITSNVTTGTATAQLTDLRSRVTAVEATAGSAVKAVEYQLTGGTLPLVGTDARVVWNTTITSNAAITYNSGTGLFTAVATGWYSGMATFRVSELAAWYISWAKGSGAAAGNEFAKTSWTNLNGSVNFLYRMTAGTTFGVYGWSANPATMRYARQTAGDPLPLVTIKYEGP